MLARSASRPRLQNSHRGDAVKRCEPYLKWLRGRPCLLEGKPRHVCTGRVRACHVDYAGDKGVATKVSDKHAVPMCDGAHIEQTDVLGWGPFEAKYRINALEEAADRWAYWSLGTVMGAAWRAKQEADPCA